MTIIVVNTMAPMAMLMTWSCPTGDSYQWRCGDGKA